MSVQQQGGTLGTRASNQPPPLPSKRARSNQVVQFSPRGHERVPFIPVVAIVVSVWVRSAFSQPWTVPFLFALSTLLWLSYRALVRMWWCKAFVTPTHLLVTSVKGWETLPWCDMEAWSVAFDGSLSICVRGRSAPVRFSIALFHEPQAFLGALSERIQAPLGVGLQALPSLALPIEFAIVCVGAVSSALCLMSRLPLHYLFAAAPLGVGLLALRWRRTQRKAKSEVDPLFTTGGTIWLWAFMAPHASSGVPAQLGVATSVLVIATGGMMLTWHVVRWLQLRRPNLFTRPLYK